MSTNNFLRTIEHLAGKYGEDLWDIRHELFFILGKKNPLLRGIFSSIRDCIYLLVRRNNQKYTANSIYFGVSLSGHSGWGALDGIYNRISKECIAPIHVVSGRCGVNKVSGPILKKLNRVTITQVIRSFFQACSLIRNSWCAEGVLVLFLYWRHLLWCYAWENTIVGTRNVLFTHNDFDMALYAGIKVFKSKGISINVQHGIPTDEFFPPRADYQAVWGQRAMSIYTAESVDKERVLFWNPILGQDKVKEHTIKEPMSISFISQSHTSIYGVDMLKISKPIVEELRSACLQRGIQFNVLLHPSEGQPKKNLYGEGCKLSLPPHKVLLDSDVTTLLVGFSSTAFIDGHLSGQYILGIQFEPTQSRQAYSLIKPATIVEGIDQVIEVYHRLKESARTRKLFMDDQKRWYQGIFENDSNVISVVVEYFSR